jgi:hypothetical protein
MRWAGLLGIASLVTGCLLALDFDSPSRGPFPDPDAGGADPQDAGTLPVDARTPPVSECAAREGEPNDSTALAKTLEVGAVVCGSVSPTDQDVFRVLTTGNGHRLRFDVDRPMLVHGTTPTEEADFTITPDGGDQNMIFSVTTATEAHFMSLRSQDGVVSYSITRLK